MRRCGCVCAVRERVGCIRWVHLILCWLFVVAGIRMNEAFRWVFRSVIQRPCGRRVWKREGREVEEEYKNNILVYLQLKLFKLRWNGNVNCCLLYFSCCCSHCCCLSWFNCSRINRTLLKSIQSTSTFLQFLTYTYRMLLLLLNATLKTMLSINVFKYKNKFK